MCATMLLHCTPNLDNLTRLDFPVDNYDLVPELCTGLFLDRFSFVGAMPDMGLWRGKPALCQNPGSRCVLNGAEGQLICIKVI